MYSILNLSEINTQEIAGTAKEDAVLFLNAVKQKNDADDKEGSFSSAGRTNTIHPQGCIEVRFFEFYACSADYNATFFKRKAAE